MKYLLLSSSLLVDRFLLYTGLVPKLAGSGEVHIWAASAASEKYRPLWDRVDACVEPLPEVRPFRELPHNYLRRLNEYVWDFRQRIPSRMSMMRHVRDRRVDLPVRTLKMPARVLSTLRLEQALEERLEQILLGYQRSPEAEERLRRLRPDVMLTTGPFQFEQPAIFAAARRLGIPTLAYIPSWDNITTKNRMVFRYDGYIVWTAHSRRELREYYPGSRDVPVYAVGAPQFDVFYQDRFRQPREEFFREQGLDPDRPLIVYALGSPNFLKEHHGAVRLAEMIGCGELGDAQMLVRPHPIHDRGELSDMFREFAPRTLLQRTVNAGRALTEKSQDEEQIVEWISSFRHADVVVNLSSTVTVDAGIFDKPVVNLDFDPQPGGEDQQLVKDINHRWNHFKPIAESGGVWLVDDYDEMAAAVRAYLKDPSLHREQRKWVVDYVCGFTDGCCGERMADAIAEFASGRRSPDAG